jgi:N-acetylmuramoyl-L-alanine amidase
MRPQRFAKRDCLQDDVHGSHPLLQRLSVRIERQRRCSRAVARATVCWIAVLLALSAARRAEAHSCENNPLRVAVDVGHSKWMYGATSATGRREYDFNRRFALELVEAAKKRPALALFLIEKGDEYLSLTDRPRRAAESKADVLVSVHHDAVNKKYVKYWNYQGRRLEYSDEFRGYSLFVDQSNPYFKDAFRLATLFGANLRSSGLEPTWHHAEPILGENRRWLNRELGIHSAPFVVMRLATMPAMLFEVGVIVHRQEEQKLDEPGYRALVQNALLDSLLKYCEASCKREPKSDPGNC